MFVDVYSMNPRVREKNYWPVKIAVICENTQVEPFGPYRNYFIRSENGQIGIAESNRAAKTVDIIRAKA